MVHVCAEAVPVPVNAPIYLDLGPEDTRFLIEAGVPARLLDGDRIDLRELRRLGWVVTNGGLYPRLDDMEPEVIERVQAESERFWAQHDPSA